MAKRNPKKPLKYPRRLRHTLERVASERVDREKGIDPAGKTLWEKFLRPKSVDVMHANLDTDNVDERHHKLHIRSTMAVNRARVHRLPPIHVRPPWWTAPDDDPSTETPDSS